MAKVSSRNFRHWQDRRSIRTQPDCAQRVSDRRAVKRLILLRGRLLPPELGKIGVEFAFGVHRNGNGGDVDSFSLVHLRNLLRHVRREPGIEVFREPASEILDDT